MTEPPKPKAPDPWKIFFFEEFKNLKIRTGILQFEKFKESPTGRDDIRQLVAEMIQECNKNPFDRIKTEVLQRVIRAAIVDDKDFIGFSVKWIRRTLNNWWNLYGDKLLREMQRISDEEEEKKKPVPTMNPHESGQVTVNEYIKRLLSEPVPEGMQKVPDVEDANREGKEWTSGVERRGTKFKREVDPAEWNRKNEQHKQYLKENIHMITMEKLPLWMPEDQWIRMKEFEKLNMERDPTLAKEILRVASDYYATNGRTGKNLEMFEVEGYYVIAETEEHAKEIYQVATKK